MRRLSGAHRRALDDSRGSDRDRHHGRRASRGTPEPGTEYNRAQRPDGIRDAVELDADHHADPPKWAGDSAVISVDNGGDFLTAWGRRVSSSGKLGTSVHLGSGFLPKVAVDPAGAGLARGKKGSAAGRGVCVEYDSHR